MRNNTANAAAIGVISFFSAVLREMPFIMIPNTKYPVKIHIPICRTSLGNGLEITPAFPKIKIAKNKYKTMETALLTLSFAGRIVC